MSEPPIIRLAPRDDSPEGERAGVSREVRTILERLVALANAGAIEGLAVIVVGPEGDGHMFTRAANSRLLGACHLAMAAHTEQLLDLLEDASGDDAG